MLQSRKMCTNSNNSLLDSMVVVGARLLVEPNKEQPAEGVCMHYAHIELNKMYEGFVRQKQMAAANTTPRRRVAFEEKTTAVLYCCCCRFFPSDLNPIASFG